MTKEEYDKMMADKRLLGQEEVLESQARLTPEMMELQMKREQQANEAARMERYANLAGKLGQLGSTMVAGKSAIQGGVPSPDMTGVMSTGMQEGVNQGQQRIARVQQAQQQLNALKAARAESLAKAEQAKFNREMKVGEFGLKKDQLGLDTRKVDIAEAKNTQEFGLKIKEHALKLVSEARAGKLTEAQIGKMNSDIDIAGQRLGIDQSKLEEAKKKLNFDIWKELNKEDGVQKGTVAQDATDRAVGKDYAAWASGQPQANFNKSMAQLDEVIGNLSSGENLTGLGQNITPEFAKGLITPKSKATRDAVWEIVQRNLRETLGAQFTQKEGEMLMARAYDEALSEEENVKRVQRLKDQIEQAMSAKEAQMDYYEKNGTMTGFQGRSPREMIGLPRKIGGDSADEKVTLIAPNGKRVQVPAADKQRYLDAGAKEVQ